MSTTNVRDHRVYAATVAQRLDGMTVPSSVKAPLAVFTKARAAYEKAAKQAGKAREARDAALQKVANADDVLDPSVDALATAMVGGGLTKRTKPFNGFSTYPPSEMQSLAYATEVTEVQKLVGAVLKKKPAAGVVKACSVCTKNGNAVTAALKDLVKPEAAYNRSLLARDALLPALVKGISKLKKHAALAWEDDEPETYRTVFAPPDSVQAPKTPTAKKAAKKRAANKAAKKTATTTNGTTAA